MIYSFCGECPWPDYVSDREDLIRICSVCQAKLAAESGVE